MKNIIFTTTNSIESATITGYLGIVRSNMVVGTNIFKDIFASFSDFFGGFSGKYKGELNRVYEAAFKELKQQARDMRADAVVGLHVDFDEISGKEKSMLMVSLVGTAVNLSFENRVITSQDDDVIDEEQVEHMVAFYEMKGKLQQEDWFPGEEDWNVIIRRQLIELSDDLYLRYLIAHRMQAEYTDNYSSTHYMEKFKDYFSVLDYEDKKRTIYDNFDQNPGMAISLIKEYDLFDIKCIAAKVNNIPKNELFELLKLAKPSYKKSDIQYYESIIQYVDNLPVTSTTKVSTGIIGKGKEYECCESGHRMNPDQEFCRECGKNRQGITRENLDTIGYIKQLVDILKQLS